MQARYGLAAIAASVLLCSGCWLTQPMQARPQRALTTGTTGTGSAPASSTPTALPRSSAASSPEPPFSNAGPGLRLIARRFVTAALQYDARTQQQLDFLARARPYATSGELRRLASSPRAQLPWDVLRARAERVRIRVVGVSLETRRTGIARTLVIEAITTTQTNFATVRNIEQLSLTVARTATGWRVAEATGAGL